MKKFLPYFLVGMLLGVVAYASIYRTAQSNQATSRVSPKTTAPAASEKISLAGCKGLRVTFCSADSNNLTGGTLRGWYEHPGVGWSRNKDLDLVITSDSQLCKTWADMPVDVGEGNGFWQADTIAGPTDGGSVYIECFNSGP